MSLLQGVGTCWKIIEAGTFENVLWVLNLGADTTQPCGGTRLWTCAEHACGHVRGLDKFSDSWMNVYGRILVGLCSFANTGVLGVCL